jgi:hypothetical protein
MRTAFLILLLCVASVGAQAQRATLIRQHPSTVVGFVGPGDIVSGTGGWYSCTRAYSAAYATSGGAACTLRRANDNTTQAIAVLPNGNFNLAAAISFAGTDATASCTAASTTLTCTGASSTPNTSDPVSAAGITQPAFIVSCGTFTAGAGTCTLNAAQTISVAVTTTFAVALFITAASDQSGGSHPVSQTTAASQPQWLPNCGTRPCMFLNGTTSFLVGASAYPFSIPTTGMAVSEETTNIGATGRLFAADAGNSGFDNNGLMLDGGSPNTFAVFSGSGLSATATNNVNHSFLAVFNSTSSVLDIDGSSTPGDTGTETGTSNGPSIGFQDNVFWGGYVFEAGYNPIAFSPTQLGNMCHNQRLFYGTPGSC